MVGSAGAGRSGRWVIGITGASGSAYGVTLVRYLLAAGYDVDLLITDAGWRVLHDELGWRVAKSGADLAEHFREGYERLRYVSNQDIGAAVASGSTLVRGMVVAPCSMGTLAAIRHGLSDNLLERAADVMLKEGRPLILVPRETPLNTIHLENMLDLSRMGVRILPAMPAFYQQPATIADLVNFLVGKILDSMNIEHDLYTRWGDSLEYGRTQHTDRKN